MPRPDHATERAGHRPRARLSLLALLMLVIAACSGASEGTTTEEDAETSTSASTARRYSAEWLISTAAIELDTDVPSPFIYREVVDDRAGRYLVETADHLAVQTPDDVLLCAAIGRVPLDPYCASTPRADGTPHVLAYPIQLLKGDWSPTALYDLAGYREVSLVAAADPDNWTTQRTLANAGFPIECFLASGETSAAATGFEICFTDDDLHLVASVDLQNDLIFEIDLLSYEITSISEDFETGIDRFIEDRPGLHEQLIDLYPEIPAPRATPVPNVDN